MSSMIYHVVRCLIESSSSNGHCSFKKNDFLVACGGEPMVKLAAEVPL